MEEAGVGRVGAGVAMGEGEGRREREEGGGGREEGEMGEVVSGG